jgi:hypothetical protein
MVESTGAGRLIGAPAVSLAVSGLQAPGERAACAQEAGQGCCVRLDRELSGAVVGRSGGETARASEASHYSFVQ